MEQDTRPEEPMLQSQRIQLTTNEKKTDDPEDETQTVVDTRRSIMMQLVTAGATFILTASCGFPIGFSAIMLPQLRGNDSTLPTSEDMGSWIASIHSAATPVGSFASGWIMEHFGRRNCLRSTVVPFIIGWLTLAFAENHPLILFGRFCTGFAVGLSGPSCQIYLSEVATPRIRGLLSGSPMVSYSFGILLVYSLGTVLHWHHVAGFSTLLPIVALVSISFLPESPVWLAREGRDEEARNSLTWFRGPGMQVNREMHQIQSRVAAEKERNSGRNNEGCLSLCAQPNIYKPFIIVNILNMMQVFSGTFLVIFYAVDLVSKAESEGGLDQYTAAVLTAAVRLIFAIVACFILFFVGRRPMAFFSGLTSGAAALSVGITLFLKDNYGEQSAVDYPSLVVTFLLIYIATNTCGFFVLPIVTIGELLPARVRGLYGGYIFSAFNIVLFGATKIFPFIQDAIGISGIFFIFGGSSLVGTLLVYLLLPETKGKTLDQVEDYFMGDNVMWITRNKYQSPVSTSLKC